MIVASTQAMVKTSMTVVDGSLLHVVMMAIVMVVVTGSAAFQTRGG